MSDEPETNSTPKEPPALQLLSFISRHFAVFSLLGLVAVVLCSTLFLYGYLTVFDWQLIWIIEYPDILKFGLVMLAVISGMVWFGQVFVASLMGLRYAEGKWRVIWIVPGIVFVILFFVIPLIIEWWEWWFNQAESRYLMYIYFGGSVIALMVVSQLILAAVESRRTIKAEAMAFLALFIALWLFAGMGVLGATLGTYAKYSKSLTHDVFLKDRQMSNVRLVLFTSHHTVLYAGNDVIILPTSEIMKISAHPAVQRGVKANSDY